MECIYVCQSQGGRNLRGAIVTLAKPASLLQPLHFSVLLCANNNSTWAPTFSTDLLSLSMTGDGKAHTDVGYLSTLKGPPHFRLDPIVMLRVNGVELGDAHRNST